MKVYQYLVTRAVAVRHNKQGVVMWRRARDRIESLTGIRVTALESPYSSTLDFVNDRDILNGPIRVSVTPTISLPPGVVQASFTLRATLSASFLVEDWVQTPANESPLLREAVTSALDLDILGPSKRSKPKL